MNNSPIKLPISILFCISLFALISANAFGVSFDVSSITYDWDPPPYGYGSDEPGNYFYLYNFSMSTHNQAISDYFDSNPLTDFSVITIDADYIQRFTLPGNFTVAWDDSDTSITAITMNQYDALIDDYWSNIAYNYILNGWVDYSYILIENATTGNESKRTHFINELASDPFAKQIDIVVIPEPNLLLSLCGLLSILIAKEKIKR